LENSTIFLAEETHFGRDEAKCRSLFWFMAGVGTVADSTNKGVKK
jgi:hypothetical protein